MQDVLFRRVSKYSDWNRLVMRTI